MSADVQHLEPKIYVFAGDDIFTKIGDQNIGATTPANDFFRANPNCIVLDVKTYPHLEDAIAQIKPPARVIVNCHGIAGDEKGNNISNRDLFLWDKSLHLDKQPSYSQLFKGLKTLPDKGQGIDLISVEGCFGGHADNKECVAEAPVGTIVQTQVSLEYPNFPAFVEAFADKACKGGKPVDLVLENLAAFDPRAFQTSMMMSRMEHHQNVFEGVDPLYALPRIIGIGGNPPKFFNAYAEIKHLVSNKTKLDDLEWNQAAEKVNKAFGADAKEVLTAKARQELEKNLIVNETPAPNQMGAAVDIVLRNMEKGLMPEEAQEMRIAYALVIAHLDTSGELDRLVAQQKEAAKKPQPTTQHAAIHATDLQMLASRYGAVLTSVIQDTLHIAPGTTSHVPVNTVSASVPKSPQRET